MSTAPDNELWVTAMDKEFFTLEKMGCREVIDIGELPTGCVPIAPRVVLPDGALCLPTFCHLL